MISRVASHSRRSWADGSQDASGARIGTGPPEGRAASRSSTRRTISIVLPDPGSPSTTRRPVGTLPRISVSSPPSPVSPAGPDAQACPGAGRGQPAPLAASSASDFHGTARSAGAAAQETGSG